MTTVLQPDELATMFREINRRLRSLESGNQASFVLGGNFGYQMVDPTYSARCRFLIPPTTVHVSKATLNFSLQPFRAAIQSATGGGTTSGSEGSHTHGVSWGDHSHSTPGHAHSTPSHAHQVGSWSSAATVSATPFGVNQFNFASADNGASWIIKGLFSNNTTPVDIWTVAAGGGSTTPTGGGATSGAGGATATSSAGGSAHTHTVPASGLTTPNALYEASMAQGCHVTVDGTDVTTALSGPWGVGSALDVHDLDVTPWLTAVGWHEIQITSTTLGGVFSQLAVYATLGT